MWASRAHLNAFNFMKNRMNSIYNACFNIDFVHDTEQEQKEEDAEISLFHSPRKTPLKLKQQCRNEQ